ncbi:MAG: GxxExxY protein [Pirellulales bacterium]
MRLVIAAIIRVHQTLGPGFIESIYHRALTVELKRMSIPFSTEHELEIRYEGELVGLHRLDLLVDGRLIVELKAIEELTKTHYSQLRSYLKAARLSVGLLVNFSKDKADYRRVTISGSRSGR